ncbi:MAG: 3-deoxy-D-manno-octulosonic acid transferase, partial [Planctomycetota bacterium]
VGGSLNERGGQNMLEPAAYGAAVLVGPNTWNFAEIVAHLKAADAVVEVRTAKDLATRSKAFLIDPEARSAIGGRAQRAIRDRSGATAATAAALAALLPDSVAATDRSAQPAEMD